MNNNILISVIIPCYNAAKYLIRTFRALDNQSYKNFEVIIIDDGSTDNTCEKVLELIAKRANYSIFSYENAGVSEARNRGIAKASGDYVYFLDADDYIYPTLFEDIVKIIKKYDFPDVVRFAFKWHYGEPDLEEIDKVRYSEIPSILIQEKGVVENIVKPLVGFSEQDVYNYYKTQQFAWKESDIPVWAHFYSRKLLVDNNLRFEKSLKMGEDRFFNLLVMAYVKNVAYTTNVYYLYLSTIDGLLSTGFKDANGLLRDKQKILEHRNKMRELYQKEKGVDLWPYYRGSNILACLQLAVELSRLPMIEGVRLYNGFVKQDCIQKSIQGFKTNGAPLKMKIPLEMLKHGMSGSLFILIWFAVKVGVKCKM